MDPIVPVSLIVSFLALALPHFGVVIANESLTTFVQVVVTLVSSLVVYFQHKKVVAQAQMGGFSGK